MNHLNLIAVLSRPLFLCLSADFSPQTFEISLIMQHVLSTIVLSLPAASAYISEQVFLFQTEESLKSLFLRFFSPSPTGILMECRRVDIEQGSMTEDQRCISSLFTIDTHIWDIWKRLDKFS